MAPVSPVSPRWSRQSPENSALALVPVVDQVSFGEGHLSDNVPADASTNPKFGKALFAAVTQMATGQLTSLQIS